ncbi:MAG: hypothetical protein R3Y36_06010 [Spirochaetales bacterium]
MKEKYVRVAMSLIGVVVVGLSVGLFKHSAFGTDPFQVFVAGLDNVIPLSFSIVYIIVNAVLLAVIFAINRRYVGIATLLNLFFLGYIVEFSYASLQVLLPDPVLWVRIVLLITGFTVLCLAAAFYITADLGVSTYDAISLIMADKKVARFRFCRIATDITCVIVGFLLSVEIGVGTVMTAFLMGPFIAFFRNHITEPILQKVSGVKTLV